MSTRETGRERYYRQVREIRDQFDISHDEARSRWSLYYRKGGAQIRPLRRLELAVRATRTKSSHCPFCRDGIYESEEDYTCAACQTHYHLDCFEDELGGRCATLGCSVRRVIRRPQPAARDFREENRTYVQNSRERREEEANRWTLSNTMALVGLVGVSLLIVIALVVLFTCL